MDFKSILRTLSNNKNIKFGVMNFSASIIMFLIPILFVLVFIAAMFSGLLGIFIGPIYTHIIQYLITGLIVPLSIIFIIALFLKLFSVFNVIIITNVIKMLFSKGKKNAFKSIAIKLAIIIFIISHLVKLNQKTIDIIRDIPYAINHEYDSIDGIVEIETDTDIAYVKVDNTLFNEGFVFKPGVVDGKRYHVEYLPHSRYIVDFTLIR